MAHSRVQGGVHIEDKKTSYQMNPGVGYTLGGGFHCTTFDNIAQIFREGLRPEEEATASIRSSCHLRRGMFEVRRC